MEIKIKVVYLIIQKRKDMTTIKLKQETRRDQVLKANELLKTCPKEQAKLAKQLRKLGLM